jgi:phosphotransferase system  glucose/maltose/N-acetylglucosamine-specific IIC component
MINATLWNLLKAAGIATLITCVISGFYGVGGLIFGFLERPRC